MTGPVVVRLETNARRTGMTVEIPRAEWDKMTRGQRAARLDELASRLVADAGGYGWHIDDPDDLDAVGSPPRPVDADAVLALVEQYGDQRAGMVRAVMGGDTANGNACADRAVALYAEIRKAVGR